MRNRDAIAVVGDVHGEVGSLRRVLSRLRRGAEHIVFVGDYVDRGPDSRPVLEEIGAAKESLGERLTLLRGNHDQVLIDFIAEGDPRRLIAHGGATTIRSYLGGGGGFDDFRQNFPDSHLSLLESTVDCYEESELLITHSGFNPSDVDSRHPNDIRGNGFPQIFDHSGPWPRQLTVCGHFVQVNGNPHLGQHLACIDTGCGSIAGAPLTVIFWPSMTFEQF